MDIFSVVIFFIYIIIALMIILYISPVLSVPVLILAPLASVYFVPDQTIRFFSIQQFSIAGVSVQNIHILLLIWSALLGVVASTEVVSWYLLRDEKSSPKKHHALESIPLKSGELQRSAKNKIEDFLLKLGKIMSGKK